MCSQESEGEPLVTACSMQKAPLGSPCHEGSRKRDGHCHPIGAGGKEGDRVVGGKIRCWALLAFYPEVVLCDLCSSCHMAGVAGWNCTRSGPALLFGM